MAARIHSQIYNKNHQVMKQWYALYVFLYWWFKRKSNDIEIEYIEMEFQCDQTIPNTDLLASKLCETLL